MKMGCPATGPFRNGAYPEDKDVNRGANNRWLRNSKDAWCRGLPPRLSLSPFRLLGGSGGGGVRINLGNFLDVIAE